MEITRYHRAILLPILLALSYPGYAAQIRISKDGLTSRTVPEMLPERPVPDWIREKLLIAHLPPADWHQIDEFIKAGYDVITVNTLAKWDRVGPRAPEFSPQEVRSADQYLRKIVDTIHGAGRRA